MVEGEVLQRISVLQRGDGKPSPRSMEQDRSAAHGEPSAETENGKAS